MHLLCARTVRKRHFSGNFSSIKNLFYSLFSLLLNSNAQPAQPPAKPALGGIQALAQAALAPRTMFKCPLFNALLVSPANSGMMPRSPATTATFPANLAREDLNSNAYLARLTIIWTLLPIPASNAQEADTGALQPRHASIAINRALIAWVPHLQIALNAKSN